MGVICLHILIIRCILVFDDGSDEMQTEWMGEWPSLF
jgi:hypothetical protein